LRPPTAHYIGNQNKEHAVIIDCHGHYTTAPKAHDAWRLAQIASLGGTAPAYPVITDAEIHASIAGGQLKLQQQRGIDLTIFSPRASAMAHHIGGQRIVTT
jgi:4-oxalmesaconate hydratase